MAKNRTTGSRRGNQKKKMEMDWSYPQKDLIKHHPPGIDLEPPGKEEKGTTKKQLEKGPGGGLSGDGLHLEWNREAGPGQGTLAVCCGWPMPPAGE